MLAYRLLTEDDTSEFCHKVTKALDEGWTLYGDPTMTFDAARGVDFLDCHDFHVNQ